MRNGMDVLLVEDDADHAELIQRSLAEHGLVRKLIHVRDGQTALDYLRREGEYADPVKSPRPSLVILDLRLPRVDGLEVLRQLKQSEGLRRLPVVILTTSAAERDLAQAYEFRANSYVVKPLDFETFRQLMKNLDDYWLGWNASPPLGPAPGGGS